MINCWGIFVSLPLQVLIGSDKKSDNGDNRHLNGIVVNKDDKDYETDIEVILILVLYNKEEKVPVYGNEVNMYDL